MKTYQLNNDLLAHGIVYTTLESGVRVPKPSRFRRLLWVCQEIVGAILTVVLAIIVPVAIYLVLT